MSDIHDATRGRYIGSICITLLNPQTHTLLECAMHLSQQIKPHHEALAALLVKNELKGRKPTRKPKDKMMYVLTPSGTRARGKPARMHLEGHEIEET